MKTTLEFPDHILRKLKTLGAQQGFSMRQFVTQAVIDRLALLSQEQSQRPWMRAFGGLKHLHGENKRLTREIAEEFGTVDSEAWT